MHNDDIEAVKQTFNELTKLAAVLRYEATQYVLTDDEMSEYERQKLMGSDRYHEGRWAEQNDVRSGEAPITRYAPDFHKQMLQEALVSLSFQMGTLRGMSFENSSWRLIEAEGLLSAAKVLLEEELEELRGNGVNG